MERYDNQIVPIDKYPNIYAFRRRNGFSLGRSLAYGLGILTLLSIYAVSGRLTQQASDREIAKWVLRSSQALDNPASLEPGQRYYKETRVVGAGRDLVEKWDMESRGGSVNVRMGPDLRRDIVGQVKVGNVIHNVVVENNWAAARCSDINGLMPTDPSTQTPEICAINADYLLAVR